MTSITLTVLPLELTLCSLPPATPIPAWVLASAFFSLTRTSDELSVVCPVTVVPEGTPAEGPYACLEVAGPLDLALTGILAALAVPLAQAGIPIFAVSTYRTDYLLVRAALLPAAITALTRAGHRIA